MTDSRFACVGCGGNVPDVDGPVHRYMLASPGCWAAYTSMIAGFGQGPAGEPYASLTVDAYAVQHPGVPNPQATQSVWVHLIALHMVLEAGWPTSQLIRIRRMAADRSGGWPWLEPPANPGPVTAMDLAEASPDDAVAVTVRWVQGAWDAWSTHAAAVRGAAHDVVASLDR